MTEVESDLVQLARLSLAGKTDDVRMFVSRIVRKYRKTNPKLAEQLYAHMAENKLESIAAILGR